MACHSRAVAAALYCVLDCLLATSAVMSAATDASPAELPTFADEIYVVDEIPLVVPVTPGEPIRIEFGVGELEVEAIEDSELRAEVRLDCRDLDRATCLERGKRLVIEPRRTASGLEVRMKGLSRRWLRKIGVTGSVRVPRSSPLDIDIGIGDVDIVSGDEDLRVDMGIGDLSVEAPGERVGAVTVRTKIGDASLTTAGESRPGKRVMLVGARVRWQEGQGPSTIEVGLRIGDARVRLH
jgi:hypothetical protein